MTLRNHLIVLTLAALLPVAVFASIVATALVEHERDTFRRGAQERTRALSTAVDTELRSSMETLAALAALPSLTDADLVHFRRVATEVLASQADWTNVTLSLRDGRSIIDVRGPQSEGARAELDESFERAIAASVPVAGDVAFDAITGQWGFPVRTPVVRDGTIKYVLSATVSPHSIERILGAQELGNDWAAAVVDRSNRFVARNWSPEQFMGQLASPSLRDALARAPDGWFEGRSVEGIDVYSPYMRSAFSGWTVSMGIPAGVFNASARRAAVLLTSGLLAAVVIAIVLAMLVGRRISRPIVAMAGAARAWGQGGPVRISTPTAVAEIDTLGGALDAAAATVREADQRKDEFLAMLSHELRNPMAAIVSAAYVLRNADAGHPSTVEAREVIDRQTRHMARLIDDLLDISRISLGKITLEREALNVADVVAGVIQTLQVTGRTYRGRIDANLSPAWVEADRTRIEQIVTNLLDNALKFTPPGHPIEVSVREEGEEVVLQVCDRGSGMTSDLVDRVFDLSVQGPRAADPGRRGLGVGLALVKRLAEMHGGSVSAHSEGPRRGALFTVRLPALSRRRKSTASGQLAQSA